MGAGKVRPVQTHEDIDRRSLELARAIAARIDGDPERRGLVVARNVCARWSVISPQPAVTEWQGILASSWGDVRRVLLADTEAGRRLRQSSPFCSVLTVRERWAVYRKAAHESKAA